MSDILFRVGLVGCGLIGTKRALNLPSCASVTHLFDTNPQQADALARKLKYEVTISPSVNSLLRSDDIDVVFVATTHVNLPLIAKAAIEAKKHVLIEKPGANSLEALQELQKLARLNNVEVHVGFNHRFHPSVLKAKELIDSGKFGKLLWLRARYGHGGRTGYEHEWRAQKSISGGGELIDQGSHLIDLTRFLVGDVSLAFSELQTSFWDMEVEDNAFIALRPNQGGLAWLHASWTEWKNTFSLEIAMSTAKLDLVGLGGSYGPEQLTLFVMQPEMGPPPAEVFSWSTEDNSWSLEIEDFFSALAKRPSRGASIEDAIQVHILMKEIYSQ